MRITTKGQVTIPQRFRLKFGLLPHTDVRFEEADGGVLIRPVRSKRALVAKRLRNARGVAGGNLTTDDVMRLTRGDAATSTATTPDSPSVKLVSPAESS